MVKFVGMALGSLCLNGIFVDCWLSGGGKLFYLDDFFFFFVVKLCAFWLFFLYSGFKVLLVDCVVSLGFYMS